MSMSVFVCVWESTERESFTVCMSMSDKKLSTGCSLSPIQRPHNTISRPVFTAQAFPAEPGTFLRGVV